MLSKALQSFSKAGWQTLWNHLYTIFVVYKVLRCRRKSFGGRIVYNLEMVKIYSLQLLEKTEV